MTACCVSSTTQVLRKVSIIPYHSSTMSDIASLVQNLSLSEGSILDSKLSTEQLALKAQWEALAATAETTIANLDALNESLKTKTYIVGNSASSADVTVFQNVFPLAFKWESAEDLSKYRHIIRWVDLIQSTLLAGSIPAESRLKVNYDAQVPREIKEKPKKKEEGAKAAEPKKEAAKEAPAPTPAQGDNKPKGGKPDAEAMAKAKAAKEAKKAAKAKSNAEANAAKEAAANAPPSPAMIDFRVGFIEKAIKHPDADSLYVSTIHMGDEEGPRTVCSGLVKYFPLEAMQERYVVVIANLKPVNMRGIKSSAMVLCASDENTVEFVNPPAGSKPGDKIFFEGYDGTPEKVLNPKKKIWEACQPNFSTNEQFEVIYKQEGKPDAKLVNKKGELCKNSTLVAANVR